MMIDAMAPNLNTDALGQSSTFIVPETEEMTISNRFVLSGGMIFDLAKWIIGAIVLLAIFNTFFFSLGITDGESMEPNFHNGETFLWQRAAFGPAFVRDDIVVINYPGDPEHKKYVKRIVGMPGDKVTVSNGQVSINDVLIDEKFLPLGTVTDNDGSWQLSKGQYFVMGDNRPNSNDSRYFGPVDKRFILGHAIAIIIPRFRLVKDI